MVSQNKLKTDSCYINEQNKGNKSIIDYVMNNNMFVNENSCFDATPPFIHYMPSGVGKQNIDVENELRNITRNNTKCVSCKYNPINPDLAINGLSQSLLYNLEQCEPKHQILPYGYNHL